MWTRLATKRSRVCERTQSENPEWSTARLTNIILRRHEQCRGATRLRAPGGAARLLSRHVQRQGEQYDGAGERGFWCHYYSEVRTGAVGLQGSTDEYYAMVDPAGNQLASTHLGRSLSLMPGDYHAKLNNVVIRVKVDPGHVGEYQSGSLMVKAAGSDYYAVLDPSGTQLASKQVNQPVSLPPGKYSVKLGNRVRPATVTAGQSVVLNW